MNIERRWKSNNFKLDFFDEKIESEVKFVYGESCLKAFVTKRWFIRWIIYFSLLFLQAYYQKGYVKESGAVSPLFSRMQDRQSTLFFFFRNLVLLEKGTLGFNFLFCETSFVKSLAKVYLSNSSW